MIRLAVALASALLLTGAGARAFAGDAGARALVVPVAAARSLGSGPDGATAVEALAYRAPIAGPLRVLRRFSAPVSRYGPGHRGVDLAAGQLATVLAAAAGRVVFAGQVAGRGVVVVAHPDGLRTEYEPVRPWVRVGDTVRAGTPIGRVSGTHRGCDQPCLHWGARRGDEYVDPLGLLRPLGPVRLLPWPRRP